MSKKIKILLTIFISLILVFAVVIGGFFAIFPMNPEVKIKSAQGRLENTNEILVASYNTAAPWGNLLEGTYTTRRMHLWAQQINNALPDSLGVQEINSYWVSGSKSLLPQYAYYGVKRGGDENEQKSEMNGIFYLKGKFNLIESDTFWISETPETESKYENAGCYRICSYVVLENKTTGFTYIHMNTHLDNSSVEAQNLGGKLIVEYAEKLTQKYENVPVVITGDFNQYSDGEACKQLVNNGFFNANKATILGETMLTYNNWTRETKGRPIDFIFVNDGFSVEEYDVYNNIKEKTNISDHYMITATLNIE